MPKRFYLNVRVSGEFHQRIRAYADRYGVNISEKIRIFLEDLISGDVETVHVKTSELVKPPATVNEVVSKPPIPATNRPGTEQLNRMARRHEKFEAEENDFGAAEWEE